MNRNAVNRRHCLLLPGLIALAGMVGCSSPSDGASASSASDTASSTAAADRASAGTPVDVPGSADNSAGRPDDPAPASGDTQPPASDDQQSAAPAGTLTGVVSFEGTLPEPRIIQPNKDPEICSAGAGEVQDVVVHDGRLAGAIIELSVRGSEAGKFVTPEGGFVLRQKNCRFSPRLLLAWDGAELTVYNDDPVQHNVNTGSWNLLQSPGGQPIRRQIRYSGTPFMRVTCNIHGWMESWVYVARSPLVAMSGKDGSFTIEEIPPGTQIRGLVSHSVLGRQRFRVDIAAGQVTRHDLVFSD